MANVGLDEVSGTGGDCGTGRESHAALSWTSYVVNALVMIMLVASALLAFAARRNAIICLAALAFLPAAPAVLRLVFAAPAIASPDGDDSTRYLLLGVINYGAVWGGFVAALLFDLLRNQGGTQRQPGLRDLSPPEADFDRRSGRSGTTHDAA